MNLKFWDFKVNRQILSKIVSFIAKHLFHRSIKKNILLINTLPGTKNQVDFIDAASLAANIKSETFCNSCNKVIKFLLEHKYCEKVRYLLT